MMEFFAFLPFLQKRYIINVWQGPKYASGVCRIILRGASKMVLLLLNVETIFNLFFSLRWTISCLSQMYLKIPLFFVEDVHTTGFLADICNITRFNVKNFEVDPKLLPFRNFSKKLIPQFGNYYIYHHINREIKRALYDYFSLKTRSPPWKIKSTKQSPERNFFDDLPKFS